MTAMEEEAIVAGLQMIGKLVEELLAAKSGKTDPSVVLAKIQTLQGAFAVDNAAADAALDAKFPKP